MFAALVLWSVVLRDATCFCRLTLTDLTTSRVPHKDYNTIQWNAVKGNAILCNAIQYNAIQHNAMQYYAMHCNTIQCIAIKHNAIQCIAIIQPSFAVAK